MKFFKNMFISLLIGALILIALTGCSSSKNEDSITIAGKKFSEQIILVHILEQLIEENTEIKVINQADLGATDIIHQGMLDKDLDMYVEYTGTAYMIVLKGELDTTNPEEIYNRVKEQYNEKYDMTWLTPFGFNNAYCIAIHSEKANQLGINTISDLKEYAPDMLLGSDFDFLEREDGIKSFNKLYNLTWKEHVSMEAGLMYSAVKENQVDAIVAYATDGRIPRYDLKILEDDLGFFPPYFGAVVVNNDTLEKHPEIAELIEELAPHLTMEKMAELNSLIDIDGEREANVAHNFLVETGLIKE